MMIVATSAIINLLNPHSAIAGPGGFVGIFEGMEGVTNAGTSVSEGDLKKSFGTPLANIAYDMLLMTAYLAVLFVVYGGFKYILSKGEPGKIASSKKIITNALIGFVIAGGGSITVGTLRSLGEAGAGSPGVITGWLTGAAAAAAALFIVVGGLTYITSKGDPGKTQRAKSMIIAALVGLFIVFAARLIVGFIGGAFI